MSFLESYSSNRIAIFVIYLFLKIASLICPIGAVYVYILSDSSKFC